jgi:5-formyltetrahydrofolate cyclo-ligase
MTRAESFHVERRQQIWHRIHQELVNHAKPDSRFHYDFMSFTPDFRDSDSAVDRVAELPCYKDATTILITADNSLEELRYRALKDGKKVIVGTYRLRRGFVLLDPARLEEKELRSASWLDGMERFGIGKHLSLAQMQDSGISIDLSVLGGLAFNTQGVVIWEGHSLFEVQWALLHDVKVMEQKTPIIAVAHSCQVVDEEEMGMERVKPNQRGEVQCDYVVTPEKVIEIKDAVKPIDRVEFDQIDPEAMKNIPPLQELKGIRMMEQIMKDGDSAKGSDFGKNNEKAREQALSLDEQAGISMMDRIMKGLKS